jgi:6-pyruvoyltetrahydropterin/6-carboxytetrahydropterin synthase
MFSLVFSHRYSMAHRLLSGKAPKCAVPHGHNELVTVYLQPMGEARLDQQTNMVVEFGQAKTRWHQWLDDQVDHALQLSHLDPLLGYFKAHEPDKLARLLITPGDPTTEMLAACFKAKLQSFLDEQNLSLQCVSIEIEETATNKVIFTGDSQHHVPEKGWWNRPDSSINDLAPG